MSSHSFVTNHICIHPFLCMLNVPLLSFSTINKYTEFRHTGVSSKVFRYGFAEKAISNILILLYNECNVD